jgi:type I restriction enzyme M protein
MEYKKLIEHLEFIPKENAVGIFIKKYADGYAIEVDVEKKIINYGNQIKIGNGNCLILSDENEKHEENLVTLECVNRLIEKGYSPQNIFLEPTWKLGHKEKGRLDILITKDDETAYLMIECKTFGTEFDKELKNTQKNGGQIFTYFQQDTKTEILMLYASDIVDNKIVNETRIIKIEDEFRRAGSVKEAYHIWNKKFHEKGFWENPPYNFKDEIFTKLRLRELTEDEGKKLFHSFATILRKHSVSDKPNAFNVIFSLFLAKLYDEQKGDNDELEFQWKKNDDPVDFQIRLHNLHKEGLNSFLNKEIEGIKDEDFDAKLTSEQRYIAKKRLLKFNKFFMIKDVFDDETFEQNQRVLKEVVQLIEKYKIRYPRKQKYLSEFFELLLTTGLKQEVGQYFTPPPIAKFIVKSLPLPAMIEQELDNPTPNLPAVIDYAVGSGHFITEIMEEYQNIIDSLDVSKLSYPNAKTKAKVWSQKNGESYSWASQYVYGIEKDYRLVKVAKVGCYFYGDGVAQIIHGDGLDSLKNPPKSYIGLLQQNTHTEDSTKNKFSVVVANPPYSVDNCKDDMEYVGSQNEFSIYNSLSYDSSEIECLFVERTKHLLKDGGVAGIILPNSILSNSNPEIYTKTREVILQNFEIIAISEFGNNTFMATNTTTNVLFLRRRNNTDSIKLKSFVENFFIDFQDNNPSKPFNIVEKPVAKYISYVWETVNLEDYISLLQRTPNKNIQNHEFYKTYQKSVEQKIENEIAKAQKNRKTQLSEEDVLKIKVRIKNEYWNNFIETEKEKLLYFILAYNQTTVIINTGKGNTEEKQFLGYYFSNTRGKEGLYPANGRSTIEECTKLFDEKNLENPLKASTYIYNAFKRKYIPIDDSLKENISYGRLIDMLTFDRSNFDKSISLNSKKKVEIDTHWAKIKFGEIADIVRGVTYSKSDQKLEKTENIVLTADNITLDGNLEIKKEIFLYENFNVSEEKKLKKNDIFMCFSSGSKEHLGKVAFIENDTNYLAGGFMGIIRAKKKIQPKYLFQLLNSLLRQSIRDLGSGSNINNLSGTINDIKIPVPPKEIQEKIVAEIEVFDKEEKKAKKKVEGLKEKIEHIIETKFSQTYKLGDIISLEYGIALPNQNRIKGEFPVVGSNGVVGFHNEFLIESPAIIVGRKGSAGKINWIDKNCTPIDTTFFVRKMDDINYLLKTLYYAIKKIDLESLVGGTGVPGLNRNDAYEKDINLPPLSEQQKIIFEIEKIETQISALEQQLSEIPKQQEEILKKYL